MIELNTKNGIIPEMGSKPRSFGAGIPEIPYGPLVTEVQL